MEIKRSELERIYNEKTTGEACRLLDISPPTLSRYIKELGIKPKRRGPKNKLKITLDKGEK